MFIFDISLTEKEKKNKIPSLQNWINPIYHGFGDLILSKTLLLNIHDPDKFKIDFPEYVYKFDKLILLKTKLNASKNKMDSIEYHQLNNFYNIINCTTRSYDLLRGTSGLLHLEYGAEIVTNAWLKMFENMSLLNDKLMKINNSKNKMFNTLHLAEAPGNFMLAINHFLKTNYPAIEWNWIANSYRELYYNQNKSDKKTYYLEDMYGLIDKFKNRWIFGSDGDGDITSVSNILSFKQEILEKFPLGLDFITSDVKYLPKNVNYSEEENYNIPVHLGHLLCSLNLLKKGGTMMLKEFTFFESASVSLLYLMSYCFEKLLIVKPETSRAANSEIYIFGFEYKNNLTELQTDRLYKIMNYIRFLNSESGSPAIFKKSDIPISFLDKILDFSNQLANTQILAIDKNMEYYKKYHNSNMKEICREFQSYNEKKSKDWIEKTKIQKLNDKDHLIQKK